MPSPFPGMDPWLEDPGSWQDVHTRLMNALSDLLVPQVRPRYAVKIEERVYLDDEEDAPESEVFRPDVAVVGGRGRGSARSRSSRRAAPVVAATVMRTVVTQRHLHVVTARGRHEVVAVIEVLSPTNKRSARSEARHEYLDKRERVLQSTAHLLEVDLLRAGLRAPMRSVPPAAYYAILSRAGRRPFCDVWPIGLRDRLPTIDLPLRGEDHVALDLQAALDLAYDRAGYDAQLDYDEKPRPPLARADATWAARCVRAWRRR